MNGNDFTHLDRHFADLLCRLAGPEGAPLWPVAALASRAVGEGHVCLDLAELADRELPGRGGGTSGRSLGQWQEFLQQLPVVGEPGMFAPLILDRAGRLYLHRLWQEEQDVATAFRERCGEVLPEPSEQWLQEALDRLFPAPSPDETDWQRLAALAAIRRRWSVISGGPGTGKTTTVVRILALLLEQGNGGLSVALAAPTGKAAARLREAIRTARAQLPIAASIHARIPKEVTTLHRLLGVKRGAGRPRYHRGNPLPFDLVVVDEASMVPLSLMANLVRGLRPGARLILLGDRDQLASVEPGAVLGDLCRPTEGDGDVDAPRSISAGSTDRVPVTTVPPNPLADSLVVLRRSYRFGPGSGIGTLSRLVNVGEGREALATLREGGYPDLAWRDLPSPEELAGALATAVRRGYGDYLTDSDPTETLLRFDRFRVLCALRQGGTGAAGLNRSVERILATAGLIAPDSQWYRGRPVMVTVNDYGLGLFNGDIGIALPDPSASNDLRVFFPGDGGTLRKVSPQRLPPHETAYALTVHKSQGSEFDRVLLVLPAADTPLLTRELIYTAITRARLGVDIWGTEELFTSAVSRRVTRRSGLRDALWGGESPPPGW